MLKLILIFTLSLACLGQASGSERKKPDAKAKPAFVDEDGDGLNDLAPDEDRDGIPDRIDPDFGLNRHQRWVRPGVFRSIPDSARQDSQRFREWWQQSGQPQPWRRAWREWQVLKRLHRAGMLRPQQRQRLKKLYPRLSQPQPQPQPKPKRQSPAPSKKRK